MPLMGRLRLGRGGVQLRLGCGEPVPAGRRAAQLCGRLVPGRIGPETDVLDCIDLGGLGQHRGDLVIDVAPGAVGGQRRRAAHLGAIHRDQPDLDHAGLRAQPQRLGEHRRQRLLVTLPEPGDRGVVRPLVGRDHPERHVDSAGPLDRTRRTHPDAVGVQRQRDHHLRVVRRASPPIGAVVGVERRQVHLLDRVEHEPGQMVLLEPLRQRRRHQEHLITLDSQEVVTHAQPPNPLPHKEFSPNPTRRPRRRAVGLCNRLYFHLKNAGVG